MTKELTLTPLLIDRLEGYGTRGERIEAKPPRWKEYKWTKESEKWCRDGEERAFYRVTEGTDWWKLDDLARGAVGGDLAAGSGWIHTTQESLERLKLLFRILQVDDRLEIRENPEWAVPYDENNAQAGVREYRDRKTGGSHKEVLLFTKEDGTSHTLPELLALRKSKKEVKGTVRVGVFTDTKKTKLSHTYEARGTLVDGELRWFS